MAHRRFSKVKFSLDVGDIRKAIAEIEDYKGDLIEKCDEFCRRMAEYGVEFAKQRIIDYDAVGTGALLNSVRMKRGQAIKNGSSWIIFTDNFYAQYVEFGTGKVGASSPHPLGNGKYRTTGWTYYNTTINRFVYTEGMKARPFMWDTAQHLSQDDVIRKVAMEVFG